MKNRDAKMRERLLQREDDRLLGDKDCLSLDLCEECAYELMEAVRRTKDGDGNG